MTNYKSVLNMTDISYNNLLELDNITQINLQAYYGSSKLVFDIILSGSYENELYTDVLNQMLLKLNIITKTKYESIKSQTENKKMLSDIQKLFNDIKNLQIAGINGTNNNYVNEINTLFEQYQLIMTTYENWLSDYLQLSYYQKNFWIDMANTTCISSVKTYLNTYLTNQYQIDNIKSTFVMVLDNQIAGSFIPTI